MKNDQDCRLKPIFVFWATGDVIKLTATGQMVRCAFLKFKDFLYYRYNPVIKILL